MRPHFGIGRWIVGSIVCAVFTILLGSRGTVHAQRLEPRAYSPASIGYENVGWNEAGILLVTAAFLGTVSTPAFAGDVDDAKAVRPRPRIGLVLSGGGARGSAHVDVLKVLEELCVPFTTGRVFIWHGMGLWILLTCVLLGPY